MPLKPLVYGEWIAHERAGVEYLIAIEHDTEERAIIARKLTDVNGYVPPGEWTWKLSLDTLECSVQLSEKNFMNPTIKKGKLAVESRNVLKVAFPNLETVRYTRFFL